MKLTTQYITGFSIPNVFNSDAQIEYMKRWQIQHAQEHNDIFNWLNGFELALNKPSYELNEGSLYFNPQDAKSVNSFLFNANFQHEEFYGWLNQIGANLANYNIEPIVVYPRLNPNKTAVKIDREFYNRFMLAEQQVHITLHSAITILYNTYSQVAPSITQAASTIQGVPTP